jgi:hypothetical protein
VCLQGKLYNSNEWQRSWCLLPDTPIPGAAVLSYRWRDRHAHSQAIADAPTYTCIPGRNLCIPEEEPVYPWGGTCVSLGKNLSQPHMSISSHLRVHMLSYRHMKHQVVSACSGAVHMVLFEIVALLFFTMRSILTDLPRKQTERRQCFCDCPTWCIGRGCLSQTDRQQQATPLNEYPPKQICCSATCQGDTHLHP